VACLFNFTGERRHVALEALPFDVNEAGDLLGTQAALRIGDALELEPYGAAWLPAA
jgi:hypothetical protein